MNNIFTMFVDYWTGMTTYEIITQLVGYVALILAMVSFQMKKRSRLMAFQMSASLAFCIQLLMAGAITGGCLDFISFIRTIIFSMNDKYKWAKSPWWFVFFLALLITVGFATWGGWISICAILGAIFSTIALWMKDPKKVRLISLLVAPCWIIYNIYYGTWAGVINEVIATTSIVIGIIRLDIKKNNQ